MNVSADARAAHHAWLLELTQLPTAAGREGRILDWIRRWGAARPGVAVTADAAGNLTLSSDKPGAPAGPPVYFTAHLDHPAFVVERVVSPGTVQLAFRGGVMEDYFVDARVVVHGADGTRHPCTLTGHPETGCAVFKSYLADLDREVAGPGGEGWDETAPRPGDVATWELPPARVVDGVVHTHACDDLAAAAAALAAFDELLALGPGSWGADVRLLFTRAEEIGFLGAIAACRDGTMPAGARVIALENSRSFEDSPIGGGPIVRVGDRLSIFSPSLTGAIARRAEEVAGAPPITASQKQSEAPKWKWQRKLMAGGACEATVFCQYGYEATCVCLPLGNYHNMADLAAVQAGTNTSPARVGPEYIALSDFDGLVDLLIACGRSLPGADGVRPRLDRLWGEKSFVLGEDESCRPVSRPRA